MQHQINIFLLLFGAIQGVLLSLWFFKNRQKHASNIYVALFLVVVSLQLTSKVITKMWLMDNVFFFYVLSYQLPYLVGPLLFLYSRSLKDLAFHKKDLLHFMPFALGMLMLALEIYGPGAPFRLHMYTHATLQLVSLGAYSFLTLRNLSGQVRPVLLTIVVVEAIIIVTLAVMVMYYKRFPDVRLAFTGLTFLVYLMTYKLISKSDFFYSDHLQVIPLNIQKTQKYAHSSLKEDEADRIEKLIRKVMTEDKLYLDSDLTIEGLSTRLSVSKHYVSQILNDRLRKTYSDFLNELRLEEAGKRLSDPANNRFTIAAIALDSGFSSVSNFNDVFKKRFGITPSKFRNQHLKQMSA